jgi:hypothetical protein
VTRQQKSNGRKHKYPGEPYHVPKTIANRKRGRANYVKGLQAKQLLKRLGL